MHHWAGHHARFSPQPNLVVHNVVVLLTSLMLPALSHKAYTLLADGTCCTSQPQPTCERVSLLGGHLDELPNRQRQYHHGGLVAMGHYFLGDIHAKQMRLWGE